MAGASTSAAERQQHGKLQEKYDSVLGCCRLMTEAHSALERSVRDLTEYVKEAFPDTHLDVPGGVAAAAAPTTEAVTDISSPEPAANKKDGKKEKKVRDPDMPKRPASAFFLFQNAVRQEMKNSLPDSASSTDVQQALAAKWKEMDEAARKPYVDANHEALQSYSTEMDGYNKSKGIASKKPAPKKPSLAVVPASEDSEEDDVAAASVMKNAAPAAASAPETPKSSKKRARASKKDALGSNKKVKTPAAAEAPAETPKAEKKKKERKKKNAE